MTWKPWLTAFLVVCAACTGGGLTTDPSIVEVSAPEVSQLAVPSTTAPGVGVVTDGVSVDDGVIHIGLLADLTGPFSGLAVDVVDAQIAFWADLNGSGGIGGYQVELHIADTGFDSDRHRAKYDLLKSQVVMFSHSTGTDQTLAIAPLLPADERLVVPLTWYSGWSDPVIGRNILEVGPNSCIEAINTLGILTESFRALEGRLPRLALATVPGEFGQDPAAGVRFAAQSLGVELVYDGEAALVAGSDISPVVAGIARSRADITWITTDPITLTAVMAGAVQLGYTGAWTGSSPTFTSRLLDTSLGEIISQRAHIPLPYAPLGAPVEGMSEIYGVLAAAIPDRYPSDAFVKGFLEFEVSRRVLERAVQMGDLTPAGVVAAAHDLGSVSFNAVSPPNLYSDDPNVAVSRASGVGTFDMSLFDRQGGLSARMGDGAVSPLVYVHPFQATDIATRYDFSTPCYGPSPGEP